jgi:hypothetical protein
LVCQKFPQGIRDWNGQDPLRTLRNTSDLTNLELIPRFSASVQFVV